MKDCPAKCFGVPIYKDTRQEGTILLGFKYLFLESRRDGCIYDYKKVDIRDRWTNGMFKINSSYIATLMQLYALISFDDSASDSCFLLENRE